MKIIPVNNYVLINIEVKEDRITDSGILIPQTGPKRSNVGRVEAISDSIKDPAVKVNDLVMMDNYGGQEIKDPDRLDAVLCLMTYDEIEYVIEE